MKLFVSIPGNTNVMSTFINDTVKKYLEERFMVVYSPLDRQIKPDEIRKYAADADVIMTGWGHPMITGADLQGTAIKLIVHTGGSVGSLVDETVYDKGIRVLSGNNMYADSVAEGVLAYMFTALRRIPDYLNKVQKGGWFDDDDYSEGILDQTVGIIGMGAISSRVIRLLKPFGVKIKVYSSYPIDPEFLKENNAIKTSLEDIFSTCKIVSLHSAMNEKNRGLIGKKHFDLLQDGAIFLNTARGRVVKEDEMLKALRENRFRAVLDVYYQEPLGTESEFRRLPNVYAMPHMAGPTVDRRPIITMRLADNIVLFSEGKDMDLEISREYAKRMTVGG